MRLSVEGLQVYREAGRAGQGRVEWDHEHCIEDEGPRSSRAGVDETVERLGIGAEEQRREDDAIRSG